VGAIANAASGPGLRVGQDYASGASLAVKFTSKERDAETGLDFFGARYMSNAQGRWTSPDPTPFGITVFNPQSWNLYAYVVNRALSSVDVNGEWWTPIHKDMIRIALGGIVSEANIARLQHRQDVMDADQKDQTGHFMAVPHQDLGEAHDNSMKLIAKNLAAASDGIGGNGEMSAGAVDHFGDAIHTLHDMTSPMHTTGDGTPRVWEGYGGLGQKGAAHWLGENDPSDSWSRFGWAVRLTLAAFVQINPMAAAKRGITAENYERVANERISEYIDRYYIIKSKSPGEQDAARQCALGNPAACN